MHDDDTPDLPPDLLKKIDQAISDVYHQAFDVFRTSDSSSPSAEVSRKTGESILMAVRESIAIAHLADNGRSSQQNRLPIELWCNVWRHLSFGDLVFATHVCKEWRTAAVNAPMLWQHIDFYTTCHSGLCYCTSCRPGAHPTHAPGWNENPYRQNATNIKKTDFDILIARSRDLPLHVTVYIVPCDEAGKADALGVWLDREYTLSRLSGLTIYAADPDAPARLVGAFSALPALRYLIVWRLPHQKNQPGSAGSGFMPLRLQLPRLEELYLSTRFLAPPGDSLPSVRTLWIEPTELEDDLSRALEACPGAVELRLNLSSASASLPRVPPYYLERWRELTASLRTVSVSHVSVSCESWLRAVFSPTLPSLYLSYFGEHKPFDGGIVLSDLGSDIRLSVTMIPADSEAQHCNFLTVSGSDGDKRTRQVSLLLDRTPSREDLLRIFTPGLHAGWGNITALTAHASLWPLVVSVIPIPDGGAEIKSVCIIMDAVTRGRSSQPPPSNGALALPALRSLRLELGTRVQYMTPAEISAFVCGLQVPLPLDVLEIERQLIKGDATATLKNLASTVTLV